MVQRHWDSRQLSEFETALYTATHAGSVCNHLFGTASRALHGSVGRLDTVGMLGADLLDRIPVAAPLETRTHFQLGRPLGRGKKLVLLDFFKRESEACPRELS